MRASKQDQQPGAPSPAPGSSRPPVDASFVAPSAAAAGRAAACPTTPHSPASGSAEAGRTAPSCGGPARPEPGSPAEAIAMVLAGLGWLAGTTSGGATAGADVAGMPGEVQPECLRGLERARSVWTAAHARVLGAFDAGLGFEADGQGSAKAWVRWQTQVTPRAPTGATGAR